MIEKEIGICKRCGKKFKKNNARHLSCWDCQHLSYRNHYLILERDKFRCSYCGSSSFKNTVLHIDHIVPKSEGGKDWASNLITSCSACNASKGEKRLNSELELELLIEVKRRNKESNIRSDTNINIDNLKEK